jgi:hypothetical protein
MATPITWHPDFAPSFSPKEVLALGAFEGKYTSDMKEVPSAWRVKGKVLAKQDLPDPSINFYGVKSRQGLSEWRDKGWLMTDKEGWFGWSIRYFLGRRLGREDDLQVARWKSFVARHNAQVQLNCKAADKACRPVQRQGLLQWQWDSDTKMDDAQKKKNLTRIARLAGCPVGEKAERVVATESDMPSPPYVRW